MEQRNSIEEQAQRVRVKLLGRKRPVLKDEEFVFCGHRGGLIQLVKSGGKPDA